MSLITLSSDDHVFSNVNGGSDDIDDTRSRVTTYRDAYCNPAITKGKDARIRDDAFTLDLSFDDEEWPVRGDDGREGRWVEVEAEAKAEGEGEGGGEEEEEEEGGWQQGDLLPGGNNMGGNKRDGTRKVTSEIITALRYDSEGPLSFGNDAGIAYVVAGDDNH